MKLVDILARELKVWPEGARWILSDGASGCYADMGEKCISLGIDCSDFDGSPANAVFEASWQAAVDALKAEKPKSILQEILDSHYVNDPKMHAAGDAAFERMNKLFGEWNGEGLPPVGTVCTLSGPTEHLKPTHPEWAGREVKIYAHFTSDRGDKLAAFVGTDHMIGGVGIADLFVPIRTPEQIAAEERDRSIGEMREIWNFAASSGADPFVALYAASYRKFEIVDN